MASSVYSTFKQSVLEAGIDLATVTVGAALVGSGYSPNFAAGGDQYYSTVTAVASNGVIGSKVDVGTCSINTSGEFVIAADTTFTAVPTGGTVTQIVVFVDTGTASTSQLICCLEGLSQATNGGNITVDWPAYVFAM
jgi:hypothetical protein